MLYIGVDLGTSAVKLLLMNAEGKIESVVSKEYPLYFPHPGWSEQKPEDWWSAVLEGLKELTENCDKSQIAGLSEQRDWKRDTVQVYCKYCICRIYRSEDPLDEGRGTGEFCKNQNDHAAKGLHCI